MVFRSGVTRVNKKAVADIRLLGGHVALDFTNTVDSRRDCWGPDVLENYTDLIIWALRVQVVDDRVARYLRQVANGDPQAAAEALDRAKRLREALYAVFGAEARGRRANRKAESEVTRVVAKALTSRVLVSGQAGFAWRWFDDNLDTVANRIAFAAAELLAQRANRRPVRECLGHNCGWLFIDTSRGGQRRWCSDTSCGSHSRVLRFRSRSSKED